MTSAYCTKDSRQVSLFPAGTPLQKPVAGTRQWKLTGERTLEQIKHEQKGWDIAKVLEGRERRYRRDLEQELLSVLKRGVQHANDMLKIIGEWAEKEMPVERASELQGLSRLVFKQAKKGGQGPDVHNVSKLSTVVFYLSEMRGMAEAGRLKELVKYYGKLKKTPKKPKDNAPGEIPWEPNRKANAPVPRNKAAEIILNDREIKFAIDYARQALPEKVA